MAEKSKITWTDNTFNPWIGCSSVSPGCKFCYAEVFAGRYMHIRWGNHPRHITADSTWAKPLAWQRKAVREKRRIRVFCASLADVFENNPQVEATRARLWKLIEQTPDLDWLLLTKRPINWLLMFPPHWMHEGNFPKNIWLGTSVCTQKEYDNNIKFLKHFKEKHSVSVTFISFEPLLSKIEVAAGLADWNIIGGESGFKKDARPMELQWVKSIMDAARATGKLVFFKQFGTQLVKKLKLKDAKGENWNEEELPVHLHWLNKRELPAPYGGLFSGSPSCDSADNTANTTTTKADPQLFPR